MVLDKFVRPIEVFNVDNKKHRQYFFDYMKTNTWGYCPIQLKSPTHLMSLASYAREELVKYYIEKEFIKENI